MSVSSRKTAWFCVLCYKQITWYERMYSHGRCPRCGYKDPEAGTVVATYSRAYRLVYPPWWRFWRRAKVEWAAGRDP